MKAKTMAAARHPANARILWLLGIAVGAALISFGWLSQARADAGYVVDFTDYRSGSIDDWLRAKGFQFERDAASQDKISLHADGRGLEVQALQQAQGLLINHAISPVPFSSIEIEWGVQQHPQGASYEHRVNNEAIMVHVFFGNDKKPSGGMFAPDLPYFIGLFLCNGDRIGYAYTGRYYQAGGRYVCLQSALAGQSLVSHFNLRDGVRSIFGNIASAVSGYSIEVDTTASAGAGRSSAFIKRIHFIT